MRTGVGVLTVTVTVAIVVVAASVAVAADVPPPWAFAVNPPDTPKPPPDDGVLRRVPGSDVTSTLTQVRDLFSPPDWHPEDHPAMPDAVAHGKKPNVFACGYCHLPNGLGRPENSSLAGLPAAYIVQQVADFKSGLRKSSEPASLPVNFMIAVAKGATDEDVKIAAEYFSALPRKPWIRVVEADTVPKTKVAGWMLVEAQPGATEPIGQRIIEMPENLERTELRDAASSFVAYVPVGSIKKGEAIMKTHSCGTCHGADLKGLGPVPPLAGRSPSYTVRQLFDMQIGVRKGPWSALMKQAVEKLTIDDMIAIAAYTSSREP